MENNTQIPNPNTPLQTVIQQPQPAPMGPPGNEGGESKKMILWLVIGLLVIGLMIGGVYLYLNNLQQTSKTTPPPAQEKSLESEVESIIVGEVEAEFAPVDQDLQSL